MHACMCACLHEANKNGALIQHKMDFVSVSKQEHVSISYHLTYLLETRRYPCIQLTDLFIEQIANFHKQQLTCVKKDPLIKIQLCTATTE